MTEPIKIDIWSDVACPWCYVGKRKLESALRQFGDDPAATRVEIEYHSFELAPDTPTDFSGNEADFVVEHRGMPRAEAARLLDGITDTARLVGLDFDFDALQHTNTVLALQLLHFAKAHDRQAEMYESLLSAYFTEGRHVGRIEELARLAAEVGLDADEVTRSLESNEFLLAVRADQDHAREYGIQGVPFFVINGAYGVSGAQDPSVFLSVLRQVAVG